MKTNFARTLLPIVVLCAAFSVLAQDEPIKIATEEVHLNITAQTANGKFVSTLVPDDLLIVEEGTPQKIESMKKSPASVLFLLDTGGNLNFAKTIDATRLTAQLLVSKLSGAHSISVMQSYNKIETVSDWTQDKESVNDALDKKLFAGNRSRFTDSVKAAIEAFRSRPLENRHLVFIGDALDSFANAEQRQAALRDLLAANITVHVIAYNKMETVRVKGATRSFQIGEERETPRLPEYYVEEIIRSLPKSMQDSYRRMIRAERLFIIRLDKKSIRLAKQKREDWIKSETELQSVAEDTGGFFQSPEEIQTMWLAAAEIAAAIDSQYVVTYTPTKPIADSEKLENRKVRVSTHCSGVVIRSRQKVVLVPPKVK